MFVACNTLCFAQEPMDTALRHIVELEFDKFELALLEDGRHLRLSEAGDNPDAAVTRLREGPSLVPASLYADFGPADWSDPFTLQRFEGICRLAKSLSIAVITIHAAPRGTAIDSEVKRLTSIGNNAFRKGLVLSLLTHSETLTADPQVAVELCQAVPAMGITLDPSHFLQGPKPDVDFDCVFPYVQNVHLRDSGTAPASFKGAWDKARSTTHASSTCSNATDTTVRSPSASSTAPRIRSTGKSKCASSSYCSKR